MKKIAFIILLCASVKVHAQRTLSSGLEPAGTTSHSCPPGYCPVLHINLEVFNFHKPRTDCSLGFGICCRLSTSVGCESCFRKSVLDGVTVSCYALMSDESVELHIPTSIRDVEGFGDSDFGSFGIGSNSWEVIDDQKKSRFVRGGEYQVDERGGEFVVTLPLE